MEKTTTRQPPEARDTTCTYVGASSRRRERGRGKRHSTIVLVARQPPQNGAENKPKPRIARQGHKQETSSRGKARPPVGHTQRDTPQTTRHGEMEKYQNRPRTEACSDPETVPKLRQQRARTRDSRPRRGQALPQTTTKRIRIARGDRPHSRGGDKK